MALLAITSNSNTSSAYLASAYPPIITLADLTITAPIITTSAYLTITSPFITDPRTPPSTSIVCHHVHTRLVHVIISSTPNAFNDSDRVGRRDGSACARARSDGLIATASMAEPASVAAVGRTGSRDTVTAAAPVVRTASSCWCMALTSALGTRYS